MRIAHLTTVDSSLQYLLLPQLRGIIEAGDEAIGISAPGPYVAGLESAGIAHMPLDSSTRGMSVISDLKAAWQLWKLLRRERFDLLHTHNPKPGLYGRVVGRLAGVPVVVNTVHGLYATGDDAWPKRLFIYTLEAIASRFSDAELVQNPEDLDLMRRWRIASPRKLRLLGNGVDLERFDPDRFSPDERAAIRSELGAAEGDIVVGTVGRLVEEKGYLELFDAARRLGDPYKLVVAGPEDPQKWDALAPAVVAEAKAAGTRFVGMRDDVDRLYAGMDIFVLASHREGFPRAAMEAAAMGLPVIATDIRGCRQIVGHGETGMLVPVRDTGSLVAAIKRLGEDPDLRVRAGRAGRQKAVREFDEHEIVRVVLRTYQDLTAGKAVAPPIVSG